MGPLNVADSVTKTTVTCEGWLVACVTVEGAAEVTEDDADVSADCGRLEDAAAAIDSVAPAVTSAVTLTVVMIVVGTTTVVAVGGLSPFAVVATAPAAVVVVAVPSEPMGRIDVEGEDVVEAVAEKVDPVASAVVAAPFPSWTDAVSSAAWLAVNEVVEAVVAVDASVSTTLDAVNKLNKLVLPPPTPTAGTEPSSVPFLVPVANGLILDTEVVAVSAAAATAGSVGPRCRLCSP